MGLSDTPNSLYKTIKLIRQKEHFEWDDEIKELKLKLKKNLILGDFDSIFTRSVKDETRSSGKLYFVCISFNKVASSSLITPSLKTS